MRKIILIDAFGLNGGAEKVMINTFNSLKNNYKAYCAMPSTSVFKKTLNKEDFIGFNSAFGLIKKIKKISPEIILLNNKRTLKFIILIKLFLPKTKIIYHSHSYFRGYFEKLLYKKILLKILNAVICVSKNLITNHTEGIKDDKKHTVIYNGFDFNLAEKKRKKEKKVQIFFWAQFRSWKGHFFLLEIINKIKNKNVVFNFVANIQDDESEKIYLKIKEKIKNKGLINRVQLHINIENHLEFIQNHADITLSCSQIDDPLPTIIIESLYMGIPILATNTGGCPEILEPYPELLSSPNSKEFIERLNFLIDNHKEYKEEELKKYAKSKFDLLLYKTKINNYIKNKI